MNILFVCTGNICRSPMAEALLRRHLAPIDASVVVASAGTMRSGQSATANAISAMAERGIDLSAHRSRRLTPDLVRAADLVVGMARVHVREAIVVDRGCWGRSFTLKEFLRRAAPLAPRPPASPLGVWLGDVAAGRVPNDLLGDDALDDVADPIGMPLEVFRERADEIDELTGALAAAVWSAATAGAP